jgi:hypothetical protein
MSRRIKSLQLRLTVELAALFFVASCLAVGGLIYSASLTAGSLADRELGLRAEDLARYVSLDENQKPRLELPPPLKQAYSTAAQQLFHLGRQFDRMFSLHCERVAERCGTRPPPTRCCSSASGGRSARATRSCTTVDQLTTHYARPSERVLIAGVARSDPGQRLASATT